MLKRGSNILMKAIKDIQTLELNEKRVKLLQQMYLMLFKEDMGELIHKPDVILEKYKQKYDNFLLTNLHEDDTKEHSLCFFKSILYDKCKILKNNARVSVSVIHKQCLVKETVDYGELNGNKLIYQLTQKVKDVHIFTKIYGYIILNGIQIFSEYLHESVPFFKIDDEQVLKRSFIELLCNYRKIWEGFSPRFIYSDLTNKNVLFVNSETPRVYHFDGYSVVFPAGVMVKLVDYGQVSVNKPYHSMQLDLQTLYCNKRYKDLFVDVLDKCEDVLKYFGDVIKII